MYSLVIGALLLALRLPLSRQEGELSAEEKRTLLHLHNKYRNELSGRDRDGSTLRARPVDMRLMLWDHDLAQTASDYAATCNKKHGRVENSNLWKVKVDKQVNGVGQNLFGRSTWAHFDISVVVNSWYAQEVQFYSWTDWDCDETISEAAQCGHMTQIVWAKSEFLGCGRHHCTSEEGNKWTNVVCHYAPGGNLPTKPFQVAAQPTCTEAGRELNCAYENLCSVQETDEQRTMACGDWRKEARILALEENACVEGSKFFALAFTQLPAVCGICSPRTEPFPCADLKDASYCSSMLRSGYCDTNLAVRTTACPATCGTCQRYSDLEMANQGRTIDDFGVVPSSRVYDDDDIYSGSLAPDNTCPVVTDPPTEAPTDPPTEEPTTATVSTEQKVDSACQFSRSALSLATLTVVFTLI